MDSEYPAGALRGLNGDVAQSLVALHDALVEMAMLLRDLQFETDTVKRDQAAHEVSRMLERVCTPLDGGS